MTHALFAINKRKIIDIIIFLVNFGLILFQRIFREKFLTEKYLLFIKYMMYARIYWSFLNKLRRTIYNTISTKATTLRYLLSWGVSYQISAAWKSISSEKPWKYFPTTTVGLIEYRDNDDSPWPGLHKRRIRAITSIATSSDEIRFLLLLLFAEDVPSRPWELSRPRHPWKVFSLSYEKRRWC